MNLYEGLKNYLKLICDRYEIQLTIKDYVGLLEVDKNLFFALEEFYIHKQPYCMYIKSNEKLWGYCLDNKDLIYRRLQAKPEPYMGKCYAGIMEYVVPICHKEKVIGSIHIGEFLLNPNEREKFIIRISKRHLMDFDTLKEYYEESTRSSMLQLTLLQAELQIVLEYINLIYDQHAFEIDNRRTHTVDLDMPYVLSHAMAFMKQNYKNDIQLTDITRFCHCSNSYLSHSFKKHIGMTTKSYMNLLRIKEAMDILKHNNRNLTELAYELGFKDSNYFSKVFKDFVKISPIQYKKEKSYESI